MRYGGILEVKSDYLHPRHGIIRARTHQSQYRGSCGTIGREVLGESVAVASLH